VPEPCGDEHPDHPGIFCTKSQPCWGVHFNNDALRERGIGVWPSTPYPSKKSRKSEAADITNNAEPEVHTGPPSARTLRRNNDPSNSHEAIERYEPKRGTARERVLTYLRAHIGEWVDAPALTTFEVGGFGGTRRLRELRDMGWPIETRPSPDGTNTWQHRLLQEQEITK